MKSAAHWGGESRRGRSRTERQTSHGKGRGARGWGRGGMVIRREPRLPPSRLLNPSRLRGDLPKVMSVSPCVYECGGRSAEHQGRSCAVCPQVVPPQALPFLFWHRGRVKHAHTHTQIAAPVKRARSACATPLASVRASTVDARRLMEKSTRCHSVSSRSLFDVHGCSHCGPFS